MSEHLFKSVFYVAIVTMIGYLVIDMDFWLVRFCGWYFSLLLI